MDLAGQSKQEDTVLFYFKDVCLNVCIYLFEKHNDGGKEDRMREKEIGETG